MNTSKFSWERAGREQVDMVVADGEAEDMGGDREWSILFLFDELRLDCIDALALAPFASLPAGVGATWEGLVTGLRTGEAYELALTSCPRHTHAKHGPRCAPYL